ncbi:MAG: phage tail sheath family protein [Clostridium sp.]
MAGGVFVSQNKIRPGAYINFKSVAKPLGLVGNRGIVTMPLKMGWGKNDGIIEVFSSDIADGKCLDKIGYYGSEDEVQSIREALKNSHSLLLFRLDSNGEKAIAEISPLTAIAKYEGVVGNRLSIAIKRVDSSKFKVITYYNGQEKDSQIVANAEELKSNDWVEFAGTGSLDENAGTSLFGGSNGTVGADAYGNYINIIKSKQWSTMCIANDTVSINQTIVEFIREQREVKGKKVQAVLKNHNKADYEGVISVSQGYKTIDETIGVDSFVAYVGGLTAGTDLNKSNTYRVIDGAVEIINPKGDEDIESGLLNGEFILSYRQDESVIIESDINTLYTFTPDKSRDFSKNRVIRAMDDVNNSIKHMFEKNYIGKVDNNADGWNIFKADIISYLNQLRKMNAIKDFKPEDIIVAAGNDINSVIVDLGITPVDSMEKLYMTVIMG